MKRERRRGEGGGEEREEVREEERKGRRNTLYIGEGIIYVGFRSYILKYLSSWGYIRYIPL